MKNGKGFTLLELMVTVAIVAIISAIALPSYRSMQNRSLINSLVREWQDSFYLAQAEAMRLKQDIVICASNNGTSCNDSGQFGDSGWIVMDPSNSRIIRDVIPSIGNSKEYGLTMDLKSKEDRLVIRPNGNIKGFTGATLEVYIEKDNDIIEQRGLVISREGNMRITDKLSD